MKPKLNRRAILLFVGRFALVYLLLAIPWPGVRDTYGCYFRVFGRMFFGDNDRRELSFETPGDDSERREDTRVVIVNRRLMHADGSGPVRNLDMNASGFWAATALLLALIFATPLRWRRRAVALILGLVGIHGFMLLFLGFCIWDESTEIGLVTLTPFWKWIADGLRSELLAQFSMAVPVLAWVLVTFRRGDAVGIFLPDTREKAAIYR